jgi:hypothetical protein
MPTAGDDRQLTRDDLADGGQGYVGVVEVCAVRRAGPGCQPGVEGGGQAFMGAADWVVRFAVRPQGDHLRPTRLADDPNRSLMELPSNFHQRR